MRSSRATSSEWTIRARDNLESPTHDGTLTRPTALRSWRDEAPSCLESSSPTRSRTRSSRKAVRLESTPEPHKASIEGCSRADVPNYVPASDCSDARHLSIAGLPLVQGIRHEGRHSAHAQMERNSCRVEGGLSRTLGGGGDGGFRCERYR